MMFQCPLSACRGMRPGFAACSKTRRTAFAVLAVLLLLLLLAARKAAAASAQCTPGTYFDGAACQPCPENTYAPAQGMVECIPCPLGSSTLGATGMIAVTSCACNERRYLDETSFTCAFCPAPSTAYSCPGGLSDQNEATACRSFTGLQDGWWRPLNCSWPAIYQNCFVSGACTGPCGECYEGHTGPLCQMCKDGMTRDYLSGADLCTECPGWLRITLTVIGFFLGLLAFIAIVSLALECEAEERLQIATNRIRFTPTLKQLLVYLAIWNAYGLMSGAVGSNEFVPQVIVSESDSSVEPNGTRQNWYLTYVRIARKMTTFYLSVVSPDCWLSSWASPLYAYAVVAFTAPVVLLAAYFGACSAYFYYQRSRIPVEKRVLLLLQKSVWRDFIGQQTTIAFSRLCIITLYIWGPMATMYFTATLACRDLASGVSVLTYDPTVPCGGSAMSTGAQLSMPGILVFAAGFPVMCCVSALFLFDRLDSPRLVKCLGFWTDFYSPGRFWWEGLRVFIVQCCVCTALTVKSVSPVTAGTFFVAAYCILVLFFKPYGVEPVPPWAPFKQMRGVLRHFRVPLTLHAREVAICVFMALGMQFHLFAELSTGTVAAVMEVLVVLTFSVGQLVLVGFLLYEIYCVCCYYWQKFKSKKTKGDDDSESSEGELDELAGGRKAHLSHKFFRSDEVFFIDAVRISPFPAEAIAQLQSLASLPDLASFDVLDAAGWIFDQGHIELQGQTLYVAVGRIASMYADLTYDISTSDEFTNQVKQLLQKVAKTLGIEDEVNHRHEVAAKIASTYGSRKAAKVRGLKEASAAVYKSQAQGEPSWQKALGASTDADLAFRWLQLQMKPPQQNPALLRAEFIAVFPKVDSVEKQEGHIEVPPTPREPPGFFRRAWYYVFGGPPEPPPKKLPDPLEVQIHPIKATKYLRKLREENEY